MIDEIWMRHGVPARSEAASFSVIHVYAPEDEPLSIRLVVTAGKEYRYTLGVGDTFAVGDETWKVDRVENPKSPEWRLVLIKVV